MSKFKRKNKRHKSENRDIAKELKILPDRTYISLESDYELARRT